MLEPSCRSRDLKASTGSRRPLDRYCEGVADPKTKRVSTGRIAMKRRVLVLVAAIALVAASLSLLFITPKPTRAAVSVGPGGGTPGTSTNFTLVGHDPLFGRGMNAALAIFKHYVYIGNRT